MDYEGFVNARICNISGHKMIDCPTELQTHNGNEQEVNDKHEETTTEQVNENSKDDEHAEVNEDEPVTENKVKLKRSITQENWALRKVERKQMMITLEGHNNL